METKRVLLTGGTGFVGSVLARRLTALGHTVHLLLRPTHDPWRIADLSNRLFRHTVDLEDPALGQLVREIQPQWIFHLAASGAYSWQTDLREIVATNVLATGNLLNSCLAQGFETFIQAGSSSEYGFKDHPPAEDERVEPNSEYAVSKVAATLLCNHLARKTGAAIQVLRLYSVFGPYEEPRRLLPTLILKGRDGALPPLVDPDVARDLVYVEDVVDAFLAAAARPAAGAVYNVGSGRQTTLRDIVAMARRLMGIREEPRWSTMANRVWDTPSWVANCERIRRELNWRPKRSFEEGFAQMIHWLDKDPAMLAAYRQRQGRTVG